MSDKTSLIIIGEAECRLWGLDNAERLRRAFARKGVSEVISVEQAATADWVAVVRADAVIEENLIGDFLGTDHRILASPPEGGPRRRLFAVRVPADDAAQAVRILEKGEVDASDAAPAGYALEGPSEMGSAYNEALRKRANPYALHLTKANLGQIEKTTFMASYKGATDFVTKYVWPWPARHLTKWAAALRISPNTITTLSLLLVLLAMWLFWEGHLLWGCIAGWGMCLLDTVDGKLARVTLTSSKWGNVYDHGIDLVHPPFWYWAFWVGMGEPRGAEMAGILDISLAVIIVGYVLGRVLEGLFLHGFGIQTHIWRKIDSQFREITARRNPNLFILTVFVVFGLAEIGFILVAVWTVLSLLFHAVRLIQAGLIKARGGEIRSWMLEG